MQGVTADADSAHRPHTAAPSHPDAPSHPAEPSDDAEHPHSPALPAAREAFEQAIDDLQPLARQPSQIWGDEREAVSLALEWSATHTAIASDPKTTARSAQALAEEVGETITGPGIGAARAMELFDQVLIPATRASDDPMNLAYIPAAPTRAAVAFDTAVSAANVFGGIWENGAGVIFAENQVLRWLSDLLGWPADSAGTFVSGGTSGNLSALATARDHALRTRGAKPAGGWAMACASTAHSSITSAARLLDMDVVTVEIDEVGHLTGEALEQVLAGDERICAVVVSGGTTNAGIVDDIAGVVPVAHRYGAWVHVDGAYGGAALTAPSARDRFAGIEQADSFVVDPHKWLFAPYDCCALLYRDPRPAAAAHSQHAAYLDQIDRGESNPSDLAVHLTRRARGLPLWYSLATHGTDAYTAAVERCLATARTVARAIDAAEHLELLLEPELSVVVFRRPGWTPEAYQRWSRRLAKEGTILCVPTAFRGQPALRLAFVNPETDPAAVIAVLSRTMLEPDGS